MSKNIDQNTTRPASVKLDHGEVIRLLKPLGDPEAAEGFYYDIEFLLDIDCKEYSKRALNKTQHEKLVEILEKSNSLLKLLQERLLQNPERRRDLFSRSGESGGAGGHFWHDVVLTQTS